MPSSFVTVGHWVPRSRSFAVTFAPAMADPDGSVTRPVMPALTSWASSYSETGVLGEAELASAEKGKRAYEEAVKQLARFVSYFISRPADPRRDRHRRQPTMPIPWGQRPLKNA